MAAGRKRGRTKGDAPIEDTSTRSGGVNFAADAVHVAGDVVGRDKITKIYQVSPSLEIKPPPEPVRPPETPGFVGRETELLYFTQQLATRHLAVISGMPGAGKTALAAMLARRTHELDRTFWHEFHRDENVTVILWKLAGFLARHGQTELWQMLNSTQQTGGQAPPPAVLIDYVFQMLRGHDYLLCFDDFEFVVDDPLLDQFVARLQPALAAGELAMIIASQRIPSFLYSDEFTPLEGLSLEDTRRLLIQRGLRLNEDRPQLSSAALDSLVLAGMKFVYPPDVVANLHARTEGNALFLTLAADRLVHTANPASFLTGLLSDNHIERFLVKEIDSRLTDSERAVLSAIAVLLGYPGTRAAVEAVLDGQNAYRDLNQLSERYLLRVSESDAGREFSLNSVVRTFYYDELSKRERQTMHHRAARFYEMEESEPIHAALHFEAAGEGEQALQLATVNLQLAVSRGQARLLQLLLTRLAEAQLSATSQIAVCEARGDLQYLLGELKDAQHQFEQLLNLDTSESPIVQARHQRKLGDILYRQGEFKNAMQRLSTGRAVLADLNQPDSILEDARLVINYASVQIALNRYEEAIAVTQGTLARLENASITEAGVLANLHDVIGKIRFFTGDYAESLKHFETAHQLRLNAKDLQGVIKSLSNLAVVYGKQNRYAEALQANQAAVEIAEQISDIVALSVLYNNIGLDLSNQGRYEQAREYYDRSLLLCEKMGDLQSVSRAYQNLGEVYGHLKRFDTAEDYLTRAIRLAEQISFENTVIGATEGLADICLALGRVEEALAHCQTALDRADRYHNQYWRPSSLDLLGRIYHQLRRWDEARACFDEACRLWLERGAGRDRASSLLEWAKLECSAHQLDRARELTMDAISAAKQHQAEDILTQAEHLQAELTTLAEPQKGAFQ